MTYTHTGKQVLRNGSHFADACDPDAAAIIVDALNKRGEEWPSDVEHVERVWSNACLRSPRREGDEYVCGCGVRYDVREEHP